MKNLKIADSMSNKFTNISMEPDIVWISEPFLGPLLDIQKINIKSTSLKYGNNGNVFFPTNLTWFLVEISRKRLFMEEYALIVIFLAHIKALILPLKFSITQKISV